MFIGDYDLILFLLGAELGFYELALCFPLTPTILLFPETFPPIRLLCYDTKPNEYGDGPP